MNKYSDANDIQIAMELMAYLNATIEGVVEEFEDGTYICKSEPETPEEVRDYAIAHVPYVIENNKFVYELADFKEDKSQPQVKFIANTTDYRTLDYSVEDVFDKDLNIVVSTAVSERVRDHPGGLMYNKGSRNKVHKQIQKELIDFIKGLKGDILIVGAFGNLSYGLCYGNEFKNRYYFSGIPDTTLDNMRRHDKIFFDDFDKHYYPDLQYNYDYVVLINGDYIGSSKIIEVQFVGDNVVSYGKGQSFTYKGIHYPTRDGEGFLSLTLVRDTNCPFARCIFLKGVEVKFAPAIDIPKNDMVYPMYTSFSSISSKYVDKKLPLGLSPGYYAVNAEGLIVFPLYHCSVTRFLQLTSGKADFAQWVSVLGESSYYVVDYVDDFGVLRNGMFYNAVSSVGAVKNYTPQESYIESKRRYIYKRDDIVRAQYFRSHDLITKFANTNFSGLVYSYTNSVNTMYVFNKFKICMLKKNIFVYGDYYYKVLTDYDTTVSSFRYRGYVSRSKDIVIYTKLGFKGTSILHKNAIYDVIGVTTRDVVLKRRV